MDGEVENHIRSNCRWPDLPHNIKQLLGNSQKEYDKLIVEYSIKNQLRHKGNLVRHVRKKEESYYQLLLDYSREHLMLYPYHLADIMIRGLRVTPFQYYIDVMLDLMSLEKSYDSLPNFTAADGLRLLGIGRNQYIDLMNKCRSSKNFQKMFRKKNLRDILPPKPADIKLEPWWIVQHGMILEEDVRQCNPQERKVIDTLLDEGKQLAGTQDFTVLKRLYERGLIYFDVPIYDNDCIVVPPLDGFVMNRVLGDYFENLLYNIFVSIDEHTTVAVLASDILETDLSLVQNALSVFCRLGFSYKKNDNTLNGTTLHPSWKGLSLRTESLPSEDLINLLERELDTPSEGLTSDSMLSSLTSPGPAGDTADEDSISLLDASGVSDVTGKRLGFLFDSSLTAFLMMGNLSATLKSHAVTLFEVGKLTDEAIDGLVEELNKIEPIDEAIECTDAGQYWEHADVLCKTLNYLRQSNELDLIRYESLNQLEPAAMARVLRKNYQLLISMAPLGNDVTPLNCSVPAHLGPSSIEINSPWFKLYLYNQTGSGPISLLISKGTRLRRLPPALMRTTHLLTTSWAHEPGILPTESALSQMNESLQHAAIFVQAYSDSPEVVHIPLSYISKDPTPEGKSQGPVHEHPVLRKVREAVGLCHVCGYVSLVKLSLEPLMSLENSDRYGKGRKNLRDPRKQPSTLAYDDVITYDEWLLFDCNFGIPLFDKKLNSDLCQNVDLLTFCTKEHLTKLSEMNANLSDKLNEFIGEFQQKSTSKLVTTNIPYPVESLIFEAGKVSVLKR